VLEFHHALALLPFLHQQVELWELVATGAGSAAAVATVARQLFRHQLRSDRATLVLPGNPHLIDEAAEERRRRIAEFLRERAYHSTFLEMPPWLPSDGKPYWTESELGDAERRAQQIRLVQGSSRDQLLLGRLVDLLLLSSQGRLTSAPEIDLERVKYVRISRRRRGLRGSREPVAEIGTTATGPIGQLVEQFASWLAVRVEVHFESLTIETFGSCQAPGAGAGQIGGTIENAGDTYFMTCDHVIAEACHSVLTERRPTDDSVNHPDIAILRKMSCFGPVESERTVVPQPSDALHPMLENRTLVRFASAPKRTGHATKHCELFQADGRTYRLPCVEVETAAVNRPILRMFGIGQMFARPGDSGSWIVQCSAPSILVGMLAAGDPTHRTSYVIHADFVREFALSWARLRDPYTSELTLKTTIN